MFAIHNVEAPLTSWRETSQLQSTQITLVEIN